jgi:hypothetical protein
MASNRITLRFTDECADSKTNLYAAKSTTMLEEV